MLGRRLNFAYLLMNRSFSQATVLSNASSAPLRSCGLFGSHLFAEPCPASKSVAYC